MDILNISQGIFSGKGDMLLLGFDRPLGEE